MSKEILDVLRKYNNYFANATCCEYYFIFVQILKIMKKLLFVTCLAFVLSGCGNEIIDSSGRCIATTQKGERCKRTASDGSSYCWQHK